MRDCPRSWRHVSGDSVVCRAMSLQSPGPRTDGRAGMDRQTRKPLSPAQELYAFGTAGRHSQARMTQMCVAEPAAGTMEVSRCILGLYNEDTVLRIRQRCSLSRLAYTSC